MNRKDKFNKPLIHNFVIIILLSMGFINSCSGSSKEWYLTKKSSINLSYEEIKLLIKLEIVERPKRLSENDAKYFENYKTPEPEAFISAGKSLEMAEYFKQLKNGKGPDSEQDWAIMQYFWKNDKNIKKIIEKFLLKTLEKSFHDKELKSKRVELQKYFENLKENEKNN